MAFKMLSRLPVLTRLKCNQTPIASLSSGCRCEVQHDRPNQRFTVTPDSGEGERSDPARRRRWRAGILHEVPGSAHGLFERTYTGGIDSIIAISNVVKYHRQYYFLRKSSASKLIAIFFQICVIYVGMLPFLRASSGHHLDDLLNEVWLLSKTHA